MSSYWGCIVKPRQLVTHSKKRNFGVLHLQLPLLHNCPYKGTTSIHQQGSTKFPAASACAGAAGTLFTCKATALYMPGPPGCSGRCICTKANAPTEPDQPNKGGSHKLCIGEASSVVTGKTGTHRGCCISPKFQITSEDANRFPLPTHRA